jgi:hypothetical protein
VKDERTGHGVYYYVDGSRYEGNWVDENKEGHGVMYDADANRYEGYWVNNMK